MFDQIRGPGRPYPWLVAAALALFGASGAACAAAPHVPGRLIVQFRAGVTANQVRSLIGSANAASIRSIPQIGVHVLALPPTANEVAVGRAFAQRPEVAFVDYDTIHAPQDMIPNDPYYANWEWHVRKIGCPTAWSTTTGSPGVAVAILDSGCDPTHPDLVPNYVAGWNFYDGTANTSDVFGHGTLVAGSVGAAGNNGIGVAGVAWNCKIMPIRVTDPQGSGYVSMMANGLVWAADHGARVANISFAALTGLPTLDTAAKYFRSKGGVVMVAAGNYGTVDAIPDDPYLITVSATDTSDLIYSWSDRGTMVDVAAPGAVYTTARGGGYTSAGGTSVASPVAAGVAALIISANPALSAQQVEDVLEQSAVDLGAVGWDTCYGWGRVNAAGAVALASAALSTDTTPPAVAVASPAPSATVAGSVSVQANATDNVCVSAVSLYVDGVLLAATSSTPYASGWDTTRTPNGSHTLKAVAFDAAGNSNSAQITVNVSNAGPDTTAPAVALSAPLAGATVAGVVTVQAGASDNVGVASVSLAVDGVLLATDAASPYAFTWDTTKAANGTHTLTAVAVDAAGNQASSVVTVTVSNAAPDTTAPTISITAPAGGAKVLTTVSVTVSASDNVQVTKVELYVDGVLKATSTTAPFTTSWNAKKAAAGTHTLQCRAYDAAGNVGTSAIVTVSR